MQQGGASTQSEIQSSLQLEPLSTKLSMQRIAPKYLGNSEHIRGLRPSRSWTAAHQKKPKKCTGPLILLTPSTSRKYRTNCAPGRMVSPFGVIRYRGALNAEALPP